MAIEYFGQAFADFGFHIGNDFPRNLLLELFAHFPLLCYL